MAVFCKGEKFVISPYGIYFLCPKVRKKECLGRYLYRKLNKEQSQGKLNDEELYNIYSSSTDIRVIKLINIILVCGKNVTHKAKIERQTRFSFLQLQGRKYMRNLKRKWKQNNTCTFSVKFQWLALLSVSKLSLPKETFRLHDRVSYVRDSLLCSVESVNL